MMGLTVKQAECLAAIHAFIAAERRAPSYQELADRLGLRSKSCIHARLSGLMARGFVTWTPGLTKTIELTAKAPRTFVLPEHVYAALQRFCAATGEDPCAVVADAVALHIDADEGYEIAQAAVQ